MNAYTGLRIALGHQARVGKDTFANHVEKIHDCICISFAENVYRIGTFIQLILGKENKKDPALLQFVGDGLRNLYHDNIFVDSVMQKINDINLANPSVNIIITDMRYPNEMDALKAAGFTTVKITRDNRVIDRDPNHKSEIALKDAKFDFHIENNGTPEEYVEKIDKLLEKISVM